MPVVLAWVSCSAVRASDPEKNSDHAAMPIAPTRTTFGPARRMRTNVPSRATTPPGGRGRPPTGTLPGGNARSVRGAGRRRRLTEVGDVHAVGERLPRAPVRPTRGQGVRGRGVVGRVLQPARRPVRVLGGVDRL